MRRTIVVLAVLASSLFAASSAYAFDCIRVSASHQGSVQSANHSGRWLLLDLSTTEAATQTLATIGVQATPAQVACFTEAYAQSGQPLHFIQNVTVKQNGKTVIEAEISQAVSRNPVFSFRLKGGAKGDKIEVSWVDNKGESNAIETAVA